MIGARPEDFEVNLVERVAVHRSGPAAEFDETFAVTHIRNPDLFAGDIDDLAHAAVIAINRAALLD